MTLLDRVAAFLSGQHIAHALIGAAALAVHGVSRSTLDQDLLVLERRVLDPQFWRPLQGHASIDVRRGDSDDPLAGVVRISSEGERDVDVVVGRDAWQQGVLARAVQIGGTSMRVVEEADLILLKLFAGGSQDKWDIEQLLALDLAGAVARAVDARAAALPPRSHQIWSALRPQR